MKLIDKAVVVAEIEKLIDEIYAGLPFDSLSSEEQTALWYVKSIMSSINNLEVKEVDLEKELNTLDNIYFELNGIAIKGASNYLVVEQLKEIAKHFYELGLNAQKGG